MRGLNADQDLRTALCADPRLDLIPDVDFDELLRVRASPGCCAAFADRGRRGSAEAVR